MQEYNAALGKLSEFCEFIDAIYDTLRDRFDWSQKRTNSEEAPVRARS